MRYLIQKISVVRNNQNRALEPKAPKYKFKYEFTPYENVLEIKGLNLEIGGKRLISAGQLEINAVVARTIFLST